MIVPQEKYIEAIKQIDVAKTILITGTASADGDSIGAQLALRRLLLQLTAGKKVEIVIYNEEPCPQRYRFLADAEKIVAFAAKKQQQRRFDLGFVLDGGSERSGTVQTLFEQCGYKVLVDHHRYGSEASYDLELNNPDASSTAEVVFDLFAACGSRASLEQEMAMQLYLAIIFDTGFFRFSLTTPKTMRIAAKLMETGIDFAKIAELGMVETSAVSKRLLGRALSEFQQSAHGKIAWIGLPLKLRQELGATEDEHERIIEHLCYIKGVEVALLLLELPEETTKVSLRSRGTVDVGNLARKFGGGGHDRASGCTFSNATLKQVETKLLKTISSEIDNITS